MPNARNTRPCSTLRWLIAVSLLLAILGCATPSQPLPPEVVTPPRIPAPAPELMTPEPFESWLENARANMQRWQRLLTEPVSN